MRNESKHTPGPWHLNTGIEDHLYVEHAHGLVCDMQLQEDLLNSESIHADARLIAAAPELLNECKTVIAGFDYDPGHSDLDDEQPIHVSMTLGNYRRMRRLIAKAEGEQMDSLTAFKNAYTKLHESRRKQLVAEGLIYCLCGREFPDGQISRILYGSVYYAENRCPNCTAIAKAEGRE